MKKHWIVSACLLFCVGAVSFRLYQMQRIEKDLRDIRQLPSEIGEWKAADLAVSERDYEILETRNLILREYHNKKNEPIHLFVIYSETNRRVCHPPVVCLIGSGVTVTKTTKEKISVGGREFTVNRLLAGGGGSPEQLVLYWYMLGGEFTDDYLTQQLRWVMRQATGKGLSHSGGAMIRMTTPISGSEEEALKRAKHFLGDLLPALTHKGEEQEKSDENVVS